MDADERDAEDRIVIDVDDRDARLVHADAVGGERGELIVLADRIASGTATLAHRVRERALRRKIQAPLVGRGLTLTWRNGFIDRIESGGTPAFHPELAFVRELDMRDGGGAGPPNEAKIAKLPLRYLGFGTASFELTARDLAQLRRSIPTLRGIGVFAERPRAAFDVLADAGLRDIDVGSPNLDQESALAIVRDAPYDIERLVLHCARDIDVRPIIERASGLQNLRHLGIGGAKDVELMMTVLDETKLLARLASIGFTMEGGQDDMLVPRADSLATIELVSLPRHPFEGRVWSDDDHVFAHLLEKLKRHDKALDIFDRLLTKAPKTEAFHTCSGQTLLALERFDEALANADETLAADPKDTSALQLRGDALQGLRRWDDAVAHWRAMHAKSRSAAMKRNIVWCLNHQGKAKQALTWIDKTLKQEPDDVWSLSRRAEMLANLGRDDESKVAHQLVIDHPQADAEDIARSLGRLAVMAMVHGERDHALRCLRAALPKVGDHDREWIYGMYADTLADAGDFEASLAAFRTFVDHANQEVADTARSGVGYSLLWLDRPAEALPSFVARTLEPDGHGHALALLALGDPDEALAVIARTEAGETCTYATTCNALVRAAIARSRGNTEEELAQLRSLLGTNSPEVVVLDRDPDLVREHGCIENGIESCLCRAATALAICAELAGDSKGASRRIAAIARDLAKPDRTSLRLNELHAALRAWPVSDKIAALLAAAEGNAPVSSLAKWATMARRK